MKTNTHQLLELYKSRDLLIFLQGAEWFDQEAIKLLKGTLNKQYPNKDWHRELLFWELDHNIIELE
jgi:hypothetical protein